MKKEKNEYSQYDDCKTKPKVSKHNDCDAPTIALYIHLSPQRVHGAVVRILKELVWS